MDQGSGGGVAMARGMIVFCEIDNVLAEVNHRSSLSAEDDRLVMGDGLIFPTSRMLRGFMRSGAEIALVSNRSAKLSEATKQWLKGAGIDYDWLYFGGMAPKYGAYLKKTLQEHRVDRLIAAVGASQEFVSVMASHPNRPVCYVVRKGE